MATVDGASYITLKRYLIFNSIQSSFAIKTKSIIFDLVFIENKFPNDYVDYNESSNYLF